MTRLPLWTRALLRLYPKSFRERHERDLMEAYRDASLGPWALAWDLAKNAVAVRYDDLGQKSSAGESPFLETLRQDVWHAVRSLGHKPAFTVLTLLTLTLGIGANSAIFGVVHWVVLRPLPYPSPEELVRVWWRPGSFNQRIVARFQETESFESLSAFAGWAFTLSGDGEPEEINGAQVTTNHFDVLGVEPWIGRAFLPEDAEPGRSDVVILSYGLWKRRYGADPGVIGRRIDLSGAGRTACTVIGVLPASHVAVDGESRWQVWVPLERASVLVADDSWFLSVVARLAPGVPVERATAEVRTLARQIRQEWYPRTGEEEIAQARVERLRDAVVGRSVRSQLWLLFGAVGVVLLVVCSNVASLLLARGTDREREIAMRSALGASRRRLFRQLMTEHLVLGLAGGMLGAAASIAVVSLLETHLPSELPRGQGLTVDVRMLGFAMLLAILSAILFGLAPAVRSMGTNVMEPLRGGGGVRVSGRQRLQRSLIVGEIAASVVLLALAGLLVRSFWNLRRIDPGFDPERVFVVAVYAPDARYGEPEQRRRFFRELVPRLEAMPGVEAVGSIHMPPVGIDSWDFPFYPEARALGPGETPPSASFRVVSPGYFRSMGIPILKGRDFRESDRHDAPNVGSINEKLAEEIWPGEDPIGKQVHLFEPDGPSFTIVGIVGNVRRGLAVDAPPEMYRPLEQWMVARNFFTLRTELAPETLAKATRDVVWSMDPNVPVVALGPMEELVSSSVATTRFVTILLVVFAGMALFLAAVGVYGVTSYVVGQSTHEIGLRMALGAGRIVVLREALSRAMQPVFFGIGLGCVVALLASRSIERLLFRVSAMDPVTFAGATIFLGVVALTACYVPARRASRIDPMTALRVE